LHLRQAQHAGRDHQAGRDRNADHDAHDDQDPSGAAPASVQRLRETGAARSGDPVGFR
jgi:hypothetical protein